MGMMHNAIGDSCNLAGLSGDFFNKLGPAALKDLSAMALGRSYAAGNVVFSEKESASGIYIVLEGEVKLSMNSSDGHRLILRIAKSGEILGLASALSGKPSEMTAETLYPAKLAPVSRRDFLAFLASHPEVYPILTTRWPANSSAPSACRAPRLKNSPASCWSGARTARPTRAERTFASLSPTARSASSSAHRAKQSPARSASSAAASSFAFTAQLSPSPTVRR